MRSVHFGIISTLKKTYNTADVTITIYSDFTRNLNNREFYKPKGKINFKVPNPEQLSILFRALNVEEGEQLYVEKIYQSLHTKTINLTLLNKVFSLLPTEYVEMYSAATLFGICFHNFKFDELKQLEAIHNLSKITKFEMVAYE